MANRTTEGRGLGASDVALAVGPLVAGTIVGIVTNSRGMLWYRALDKPSWTPPGRAFGPVWTVLYLLMGVAAVLVRHARRESRPSPGPLPADVLPAEAVARVAPLPDPGTADRRAAALRLFAVQLALNLAWSVIFFGLRLVRPAAVEIVALWGTIAATVVAFARVRPLAAVLLLPYLAWTTLATLLNLSIARRNPRA